MSTSEISRNKTNQEGWMNGFCMKLNNGVLISVQWDSYRNYCDPTDEFSAETAEILIEKNGEPCQILERGDEHGIIPCATPEELIKAMYIASKL